MNPLQICSPYTICLCPRMFSSYLSKTIPAYIIVVFSTILTISQENGLVCSICQTIQTLMRTTMRALILCPVSRKLTDILNSIVSIILLIFVVGSLVVGSLVAHGDVSIQLLFVYSLFSIFLFQFFKILLNLLYLKD